jgi:hypothetical protein
MYYGRSKKEHYMRDLINSMMNLSFAMTLFGVQQLRNTVEGVVDATRWTFFTGFTCPDCGTQQEVARDFRKTVDTLTKDLSSKLDAGNKHTFDSLTGAGSQLIVRAFDAANAVYPVSDDLPPKEDRPLPPRGYDKRPAVPALDPRRLFEIGQKQIEVTAGQLSRIVSGNNGSVKP